VVLSLVDWTGGRVKVGGEEWSARAFLHDEATKPGEHVEVVEIDGATTLVL
jgi:membrane protein implicated in regulation of membrane protease activity